MMQAQGDLKRLTHGPGRRGMRGQKSGHADEHVTSRISAATSLVLRETGVDDLESVEPSIFSQHRMAEGG
jgi:hypothetical protein